MDGLVANFAAGYNRGFSGLFDEHNVMIGFQSKDEAMKAFLSNYERGWDKNVMSIKQMNIKKLAFNR